MSIRLLEGDALVRLAEMPAASIDACVTDPPYGLEFMSVAWDTFSDGRKGGERVPNTWSDHGSREHARDASSTARIARNKSLAFYEFSLAWAEAAHRVVKPGGYLLAFGGTRKYHRLTCAIEDAGFEVRDCLMWLYGSGFPKGKGCLKPGWEPIVLARKPGPRPWLNVDGCRIGAPDGVPQFDHTNAVKQYGGDWDCGSKRTGENSNAGRWPANVVLDEDAAALLDEQSGERKSGGGSKTPAGKTHGFVSARSSLRHDAGVEWEATTGGASRFFFVSSAKAENGTIEACESVNNAVTTSSPSSGLGASVPSGAATSALPEGTLSNGSMARSTNGTPSESRPQNESATPTIQSTETRCSPESPRENIARTVRASDAVPLGLTDITTTMGSRSTSGGCVGPAISSTTPSTSEPGAAALPIETEGTLRFSYTAKASPSERGAFNDHPTVKPLALMRWLVRLVTPPGGTLIDPFMGSGSTLIAADREGFDAIGIDADPHAVEIARRRLAEDAGPLFSEAALSPRPPGCGVPAEAGGGEGLTC